MLNTSVLTLGRPRHALSRVRFIGPCPPLAPLPLTCISDRHSHPWCKRARRNGRRPFSSLMVHLPSSSMVGPCDGRASARVDHQRVGVRLGRCHMRHRRRYRVVGTLPVGDNSSTIHPSFSSRRHCKGI
jgi:hypothetical protein